MQTYQDLVRAAAHNLLDSVSAVYLDRPQVPTAGDEPALDIDALAPITVGEDGSVGRDIGPLLDATRMALLALVGIAASARGKDELDVLVQVRDLINRVKTGADDW